MVYVSESGNDDGSGTADAPLRSISAAKDKALALAEELDEDITVKVSSGSYFLPETLSFTEADNTKAGGHKISLCGVGESAPVLHGGVFVTGWSKQSDGIWKASLPSELTEARELYIGGELRRRAQSKYSYLAEDYYYQTEENKAAGKPDGVIVTDVNFPDFDGTNAELVYNLFWTNQRVAVKSVTKNEDGSHTLLMKQPYYTQALEKNFSQTAPGKGASFSIENALAFLDEEGEFYVDNSAKIVYYKAYGDENPNEEECVIPKTEVLLSANGFDNLELDGLEFRYGAWNRPNKTGVTCFQADALIGSTQNASGAYTASEMLPVQIALNNAEGVTVKNCKFRNMASGAIGLLGASKNNRIEGNVICDVSGSGITVGDWRESVYGAAGTTAACSDNTIRNNVIRRAAQEYQGSVGICVFYANNITIQNNDISELPYSGISLGWGWGSDTYPSGGHIVKGNRIANTCSVFEDGGAIYMLGDMPGTVLSENYLSGCGGYGAIYFDSGTAHVTAEQNVITESASWLQGLDNANDKGDGVKSLYRTVQNNWCDTAGLANYDKNTDTTTTVQEPTVISAGNIPAEAQSIMNAAGVGADYQALTSGLTLAHPSPIATAKKPRYTSGASTVIAAVDYENYFIYNSTNINKTEPKKFTEGGMTVIGDTRMNDWLEYKLSVAAAGSRELLLRYAATDSRKITLTLTKSGATESALSKQYSLETCASYWSIATLKTEAMNLEAGDYTLRVAFDDGGVSFQELELRTAEGTRDSGFDDGSYQLPSGS